MKKEEFLPDFGVRFQSNEKRGHIKVSIFSLCKNFPRLSAKQYSNLSSTSSQKQPAKRHLKVIRHTPAVRMFDMASISYSNRRSISGRYHSKSGVSVLTCTHLSSLAFNQD
jgi:hypothetical protein